LGRDARALADLTRLAPELYASPAFIPLAYAVGEMTRYHQPEVNEEIDAVFPTLIAVFSELARKPPFEDQCMAVDVLRRTGDARVATPLQEIFEQEGAGQNCPTVTLEVGELAPELVVSTEPFRLRVIRGLAMVAVGNEPVLRWARERVDSELYSEFVRRQLKEMLRLVDSAESER
jgi:hypothetical protein